jgi:hypothetical protein
MRWEEIALKVSVKAGFKDTYNEIRNNALQCRWKRYKMKDQLEDI